MRLFLPVALLLAAPLLAALPARADDLALRRVMLSTAGVGYFEYAATVDGAVPLTLDVLRSQVDDVLASLVVFDDAGRVGGATLAGADAAQAAFAALPFGREALGSARDLLNALAGTEVAVRGPQPMTGRVLRAETVTEPSGRQGGVPRTRVTLLTADGMQQFVLEDAAAVQVADPLLRARLADALAALRGAAAAQTRRIALDLAGTGRREVRVGFVAAAPLWKATYRLLLPAQDGAPARLQAWAVLENDGTADWKDVDLTLQYGNPVTFRQALYRSYYVARPEVPVEVLGRLLPGVDTGARRLAAAPMPMRAQAAPAPAPVAALAAPAAAAAPAEDVAATLFHLPAPVSLPAGDSATLPILDRMVPAARVFLLEDGRPPPFAAVRLSNDSASSLPAGILTLYDGADAAGFAGDARLGGLPAGESRLLSFAEDLRTSATWQADATSRLAALSAAGGVLHLTARERWTMRVTLTAPAREARNLLVEIGKRPGTLAAGDDAAPVAETATAWRFAVALGAGETRVLTVRVDRTTEQDVALLEDEQALVRVLADTDLQPAARTALEHLAGLRSDLAARRAARTALVASRAAIERDEDRLRRNLGAVPTGDALHGRLVQSLAEDEAQLAGLAAREDAAARAAQAAEAALRDAVLALRL